MAITVNSFVEVIEGPRKGSYGRVKYIEGSYANLEMYTSEFQAEIVSVRLDQLQEVIVTFEYGRKFKNKHHTVVVENVICLDPRDYLNYVVRIDDSFINSMTYTELANYGTETVAKFKVGDKVLGTRGKGVVKYVDNDELIYAIEHDYEDIKGFHGCGGHTHVDKGWWYQEKELTLIIEPKPQPNFKLNDKVSSLKYQGKTGKIVSMGYSYSDGAWIASVHFNIGTA